MTEIFLNERRIMLSEPADPGLPGGGLNSIAVSDHESLSQRVDDFLTGDEPVLLVNGEPDQMWTQFLSMFKLLPAAGGVVKSDKGYLFIFRKGRWDLPKGKIDKGETPEEAALREVREETGLRELTICQVLPTTWHLYSSPWKEEEGKWILKETSWFLMQGNAQEPLFPETAEGIESAEWIPEPELDRMKGLTYPTLVKVINSLSGKK